MTLLWKLIDGLYLPEIILLILGTILFFVLLWILIHKTRKGESTGISMLLVPIIMIGYPSITKIRINENGFEMEKLTNRYASASGLEAERIREDIRKNLKKIESRPIVSSDMQITIARAQAAIGEKEKALSTVNKILHKKPNLAEAVKLHRKLSSP